MSRKVVTPAEPTHLDRLRTVRDTLERTMRDCEERNLAPIAGRLQAVLAEIAVLERALPKRSKVDELANRRQARRTSAARGSAPAPSGVVVGKRGRGVR